jgi:hypothetical protein
MNSLVFAVNGQIGATGLYLLFAWLLSGALSAAVAARKGYGERVGLTFGLLLSVVGLLIVLLLLPGRPGSAWKREGPLPAEWRSRLRGAGGAGAGGRSGPGGSGPGGSGAGGSGAGGSDPAGPSHGE